MDNRLVVRVMTGDMSAFQRVFDEMAPAVFQRARIVLGDDERAYRVVRNTFADIYRFSWRLEDPEHFEGWAYRITNHHIRVNSAGGIVGGNLQNVWNELYSELLPPAQNDFETFPVHEDKVVSYMDAPEHAEDEPEEWEPILFPPELGDADEPSLPAPRPSAKPTQIQLQAQQAQHLEQFVREFDDAEQAPVRIEKFEPEPAPEPAPEPRIAPSPQIAIMIEPQREEKRDAKKDVAIETDPEPEQDDIVIYEQSDGEDEQGAQPPALPVARIDQKEQADDGDTLVIVEEAEPDPPPAPRKKQRSTGMLVFLIVVSLIAIAGIVYIVNEIANLQALIDSLSAFTIDNTLSS